MVCGACGAPNPDGALNCASCGTPLQQPQQQQFYGQQQQFNGQPYNGPQQVFVQAPPPVNYQKREIVMAVIYTIITCGIYGIYWFIKMTDESNQVAGDPSATSGGMAFLLSIVTCGIYSIYWAYKRGEIIDNYYVSRGLSKPNNAVLYLVLALVFPIATYCLLQSELNKIVTGEI